MEGLGQNIILASAMGPTFMLLPKLMQIPLIILFTQIGNVPLQTYSQRLTLRFSVVWTETDLYILH